MNRSENMRRIRSKNTKPEMLVRQLVFGMGYRYRIHYSRLPGNPDLVFSARRKAIFVHGCFWHRHPGCKYATTPKSNQEYWKPKFERNQIRDQEVQTSLKGEDWKTLVIWECEIKDEEKLRKRIQQFLGSLRML